MIVVKGKVVRGEGIGKKLGFPTANVKVTAGRPPRGVWKVIVHGTTVGEKLGACNVGVRPTLGGTRLVVEVHIPRFRGSLYGKILSLSFVSKIRSERKFSSLDALKKQIKKDVAALTRRPPQATMNA